MSEQPEAGTEVGPYAHCLTCDVDLQTHADGEQHMHQTYADSTPGERQSHRLTILNPTPEQRRSWAVDTLVEDAMDRAYDHIAIAVDTGKVTDAEVRKALKAVDVEEGWDSYNEVDPLTVEREEG